MNSEEKRCVAICGGSNPRLTGLIQLETESVKRALKMTSDVGADHMRSIVISVTRILR